MKYIITENQSKILINNLVNIELNEQKNFFQRVKNKLTNWWKGDECSNEQIKSTNDWKQLYQLLVANNKIKKGEPILILWGNSQTMYYTTNGKNLIKSFKVSTGKDGFGNLSGLGVTNTGLMKLGRKIRAPKLYQVLISKSPTNTILGPNMDSSRVDDKGEKHGAEVLTGLIELIGLEKCNKNVYSRSIYIHGTNREKYLGQKVSNGCVRVSNNDILYLLKTLSPNTKVYIKS
jgi:hypothetical protein